MKTKKLSFRQNQVLEFVKLFIRHKHVPPTRREIAAYCGISNGAATGLLHQLRSKGLVEWEAGKQRTLRVLPQPMDWDRVRHPDNCRPVTREKARRERRNLDRKLRGTQQRQPKPENQNDGRFGVIGESLAECHYNVAMQAADDVAELHSCE